MHHVSVGMGVSNRWTGIWIGMMEWKVDGTVNVLDRVAGTAQSRLNYPVYL